MAFGVDYRWCDYEGVTEVELTDADGGSVVIAPDSEDLLGNATYVQLCSPSGRGVGKIFSSEELNQLIAELQRARSGCFTQPWPRVYEAPVIENWDEEEIFPRADDEATTGKTHKFVFDPTDKHLSVQDVELTNRLVVPLQISELLDMCESAQAEEGDTIELHIPMGAA